MPLLLGFLIAFEFGLALISVYLLTLTAAAFLQRLALTHCHPWKDLGAASRERRQSANPCPLPFGKEEDKGEGSVVCATSTHLLSRSDPRFTRILRARLPMKTFALVIPAHDEELLLGRLLDSLEALDYPQHLYSVHVVADNCRDNTAAVARARGASVHERQDVSLRGKGYALRWLLLQLFSAQRRYDAFVVLDADSVVSPNFLQVMNDMLVRGSLVVQAYYTVANPTESWNTALRYIALSLVHYLRPLGKSFLGASTGLKGNGMCFDWRVIEEHGWSAFSQAEDVEYHLRLVSSGIVVDFAPTAVVYAEMPASLRVARSQNLRWERGRLQMVRRHVPGLLRSGLTTRNLAQIDAALEQLVPPFSLPVALSALCLVGGLALGSTPVAIGALGLLFSHLLYVISGLILVRAPLGTYLSLLRAPIYVAWKTSLYAAAFFSRAGREWVRTSRG